MVKFVIRRMLRLLLVLLVAQGGSVRTWRGDVRHGHRPDGGSGRLPNRRPPGWRLDEFGLRVVEPMLAFPYLLLTTLVFVVFGPGLARATVPVAIAKIPHDACVKGHEAPAGPARRLRGGCALGISDRRAIMLHVLTNALVPAKVLAALALRSDALSIAWPGVLELGAKPPISEWGLMVTDGRSYLFEASHIIVFPSALPTLLVVGFNLLGDGLCDTLDPRLRRS